MGKKLQFKELVIALVIIVVGNIYSTAQSLTAAQMNIYFGHPKSATMTNSQGTVVTEFDREGRVINVTQGSMRMVYEWSPEGDKVTLSMFQGQSLKESGVIEISEFTKTCYKYVMGGATSVEIAFKENGAMEKSVMTNQSMTLVMTYFYHNLDDVYPYAIEQSLGNQSIKASVTIDEKDSYGNAVRYTQEIMGQKDVTQMMIDYY